MITDTLSNIISNDKSCLLGLAKLDDSCYLYSLAPLNENFVYPSSTCNIDTNFTETNPYDIFGEWAKECGIYIAYDCDCFLSSKYEDKNYQYKPYIYSSSDWKIVTNLNLKGKDTNIIIGSDVSILTSMKFNNEKIQSIEKVEIEYISGSIPNPIKEEVTLTRDDILTEFISDGSNRLNAIKNKINEIKENAYIQILKQDNIIDMHASIYSDDKGKFGEIVVKVQFTPILDEDEKIEKERAYEMKVYYEDFNELVEKFNTFLILINSSTNNLSLYVNNFNKASGNLVINDPYLLTLNNSNSSSPFFIIGGDEKCGSKNMMMNYIFVFNRILDFSETSFLNTFVLPKIF